jgi:hypothetical protein
MRGHADGLEALVALALVTGTLIVVYAMVGRFW